MSDFLGRLADRALGRAASIKPLIASRFSPDPRRPEEPAALQVDELTQEREQSVAPRFVDRRDERPVAERAFAPPAEAETVLHPTPVRDEPAGPAPRVEPSWSARPLDPPPPREPSAPTATAPPEANVERRPATIDAPPLPRSGERLDTSAPPDDRVHRRLDRDLDPSSPVAPTHPHPKREAPIDAPIPLRERLIERELPGAATPASKADPPPEQRPQVIHASVPPAPAIERAAPPRVLERAPLPVQMPQAPRREADTPSSAPTIRVSIGRIEVRAVAPTPAPASPRPAAPKAEPATISLKDYLKQAGGRR